MWVDYKERSSLSGIFYNLLIMDEYDMLVHGRHARIQHARFQHDGFHEMINDAFEIGDRMEPETNLEDFPSEEARPFYQ